LLNSLWFSVAVDSSGFVFGFHRECILLSL
jgi:hypothetical protein